MSQKHISKNSFNKNVILLVFLLIVMVICGYMNIKHKNKDTTKILGEAEYVSNIIEYDKDIFYEDRMEIEKARDTELSYLKTLLESNTLDEESKNDVRNSYIELSKSIELEKICEKLIGNKINSDVMVIINPPQASVTIDAEVLNEIDLIRIKEVILSQTSLTPESVKISLID
ncbi:MAG: SpoIIIAH-like family protein [Clostridia bacterium]|nr:SpoIIIAH-like family protein [Clostridia bacterium]